MLPVDGSLPVALSADHDTLLRTCKFANEYVSPDLHDGETVLRIVAGHTSDESTQDFGHQLLHHRPVIRSSPVPCPVTPDDWNAAGTLPGPSRRATGRHSVCVLLVGSTIGFLVTPAAKGWADLDCQRFSEGHISAAEWPQVIPGTDFILNSVQPRNPAVS